MNKKERVSITFTSADFPASEIDHSDWKSGRPVVVSEYWSGEPAPPGRHFEARMLWSDEHLYIRFDAAQAEPLVESVEPDLASKTLGLWDRDVVEIFIAPDPDEPRRYFEFEAAPNGEWVDLAIDLTSGSRETDVEYSSGMQVAARVEDGRVVTAIKIPWSSLHKRPESGEVWLGNLFRCVGRDPDRGYLAWSPTLTEKPNFHVPERFGEFKFVGKD
jgi:hypothetical protein